MASETTAPQGQEPEASRPAVALRYLSQGSTYFSVHTERQRGPGDTEGSATERFVDCNVDGLLTGIAGRVDGDGNFTNLTAYCQDIQADGSLGAEYSRAPWGVSEESRVKATSGYVAVGVGGVVNSNNFVRAVIRECQWIPSTRRLDASTCRLKSSDNNTAMEWYYSSHEHIYGSFTHLYPYVAIQGFGLTAGSEALKAIRLTGVYLR